MTVSATITSLCLVASIATAAASNGAFAEDCSNEQTHGQFVLELEGYRVLGYTPKSAVGKPAPLVVSLHKSGGTGQSVLSEVIPVAEENGFVMIAPDGIIPGYTWNVPGVPAFGSGEYPAEGSRDDVEFISRAIDEVIGAKCIDATRVYVIGYSGGGRMAAQLACDLSDRIASVTSIGGIRFSKSSDREFGLPHAVECDPGRAVPVQAIHGIWDGTNPWERGKPGTYWSYSGETALTRWAEHNGCGAEPVVTELADGVEQHEYPDCRDASEVIAVLFLNLGHDVPREPLSPINGYSLAWDLVKNDRLPD